MNPLGVHFIPVHQGQPHYEFVRSARPGVVKLVSSNQAPDVQMMATMYECAPDAVHVYRNVPLSEQHADLWSDPVGTARRHVANWDAELRERRAEAARRGLAMPPQEQTMTLGINEPVIELFERAEDMSNYPEWLAMMRARTPILDDYMATYATESRRVGQPCCVGNFSGGQPANLRPGGFATYDWFPKTRRVLEANRGFVSLGVHEYWDIPGPGENPDWWTYRFFHCDWDTDIYVLESGVDRGIRGQEWKGNRGWFGHMTGQQYADQHGEHIRHCRQDRRFRAATPFTLDGDEMWWSFWVDNCMAEMTGLSEQLQREVQPGTTPPNTIHIPIVVVDNPEEPVTPPDSTPPVAPQAGIVDPLVAEAIMQVESGGAGFTPSGRLKVRVEAHLLLHPSYGNPPTFAGRFRVNEQNPLQAWYLSEAGQWIEYHAAGQAGEWAALELALGIDRDAALRCSSMGASQVMGFNHAMIGYASVEAMFAAFSRSGAAHVLGLLNYCLAKPGLVQAMRVRDWPTVGRLYNGAASAGELYRRAYEGLA